MNRLRAIVAVTAVVALAAPAAASAATSDDARAQLLQQQQQLQQAADAQKAAAEKNLVATAVLGAASLSAPALSVATSDLQGADATLKTQQTTLNTMPQTGAAVALEADVQAQVNQDAATLAKLIAARMRAMMGGW